MIANRVKIFREKNNLTQQQLGEAVGVSRQTIIAVEKGNYEPSLGLALKLAKIFSAKGGSLPVRQAGASGGKIKVEDLFVLH